MSMMKHDGTCKMFEVRTSNAGAGAALYCARGPPSPEQLLSDDGVEGLRMFTVCVVRGPCCMSYVVELKTGVEGAIG